MAIPIKGGAARSRWQPGEAPKRGARDRHGGRSSAGRSLTESWHNARSGLWLLPSALTLGAVALAVLTLYLDAHLGVPLAERVPWLFAGTSSGARELLSAVASSLITVAAVVFSVSMIAMQQAATQYSPRVLRNFTKDRGNQFVLGMYVATFTYALLVLRQIHEPSARQESFVPRVSILLAMVLALACLGLLVYFIHHAAQSIESSHLLATIRRDLDRELETLLPEGFGEAASVPPDAADGGLSVVRSQAEGYLRRIDCAELTHALAGRAHFSLIPVRIGQYVQRGTPLLQARCKEPPPDGFVDAVHGAFNLQPYRSIEQDPLFGVQNIVDIAVKALSPGINDPTTAEQAVEKLGGALQRLLEIDQPSSVRRIAEDSYVDFSVPSFDEYARACVSQIRHAARRDLKVTMTLLRTLRNLEAQARQATQAAAIRHQIQEILEAVPAELGTRAEFSALRDLAAAPEKNGASP